MLGVRSPERASLMAQDAQAGALRRSNKRMHATRDTSVVINLQRLGRARDARRWAAGGVAESSRVGGPDTHERKRLRLAGGAWFSSPVCAATCWQRAWRAPRSLMLGSPPNKRMHPTAGTRVVI